MAHKNTAAKKTKKIPPAKERARIIRKMTSGKKPTPAEKSLIKAFFGF